jgi:hypothetical protein
MVHLLNSLKARSRLLSLLLHAFTFALLSIIVELEDGSSDHLSLVHIIVNLRQIGQSLGDEFTLDSTARCGFHG